MQYFSTVTYVMHVKIFQAVIFGSNKFQKQTNWTSSSKPAAYTNEINGSHFILEQTANHSMMNDLPGMESGTKCPR